LKKNAIEEMKHLGSIMERIYLLGGEATTKPSKIKLGNTLKEMANLNITAENEALEMYRQIIDISEKNGDKETNSLFRKIYEDEEKHLLSFDEYKEIAEEPSYPDPPKSTWREVFNADYIAMLNDAVAAEFSAIVQYTNQHEKAAIEKLRKKSTPLEVVTDKNKARVISDLLRPIFLDEMRHLEMIAERIFEVEKEAIANVKPLPQIGATPDDWLMLNRQAENDAIMMYRDIIKKAIELCDFRTRKLFEDIIIEEEAHYWKFDDYV
jgi:bacterioferritin